MTGGAGRHAAPYLHHLPCARREKDCQPIASPSCARLVTAKSGGFTQKQAGQDFERALTGSTIDRRRLLSTQTLLAARPEAGCPQPGPVEEGQRGEGEMDGRGTGSGMLLCLLIARCVDAWMRIENPVAFFSSFLGINGGGGRQASRQRRFCCLGVAGTGSAVADHLYERRNKRRRDSAYFELLPGRPGWRPCNWRGRGLVASAVDCSRFFFLGSNHDDTQGLRRVRTGGGELSLSLSCTSWAVGCFGRN